MPRLLAILATILLLTPLAPVPAAAQSGGATYFVAPVSLGDGSGRDAANAADLSRLNRIIRAATPGDEVILLADRGVYNPSRQMGLSNGGTAAAPITVRGGLADGTRAVATFVSNRENPWVPGGKDGKEMFRLKAGADHLALQDLHFADVGIAVRVTADIRGLNISHVTASNVRRFLHTQVSGGETTASLIDSTVTDVVVDGFSKSVIRLQYDSHDILIERVEADSQRQDGDNFAMGVHISGTSHDITLRHVGMHNSHDTANAYYNGDGFAAERGTYDLTFEWTSATGSSDAGYDLKSTGTVLIGATAAGNKRNFRLWAEATVIGCSSGTPVFPGGTGSTAHIWVDDEASVSIHGCRFTGDLDTTVLDAPETATVVLTEDVPAEYRDRVTAGGQTDDGASASPPGLDNPDDQTSAGTPPLIPQVPDDGAEGQPDTVDGTDSSATPSGAGTAETGPTHFTRM